MILLLALAYHRRLVAFMAVLCFSASVATAQTVEKCQPVSAGSSKFDFDLSLPTPDQVKSIDIAANGTPLGDKAKLDMRPIDDTGNDYVCDVVFLIDKAAGNDAAGAEDATHAAQSFLKRAVSKALATNRNRQLTREQVAKQNGSPVPATAAPLYQMEVASLDGPEAQTLVSFGSDEARLNEAIKETRLTAGTTRIAHGLQSALDELKASSADRKFIVLISSGHFSDPDTAFDDVIRAAKDAKIKICSVGLNDGANDDGLNQLANLAGATTGFSLSTDKVKSDGEYPLAEEKIDDLLTYMVSGVEGTFELTGLSGPVTVGFEIKTAFDKTYSVVQKVEVPAAAVVVPSTHSNLHPGGADAASVKAKKAATFADWMVKNPLAGIAAGVVLLVLLLLFFMRAKKAPSAPEATVEIPDEDAALSASETQPMPRDITRTPEEEQLVLAWLVQEENRHPLGKRSVSIGRRSDNDIVLDDDSVSQYHAEIIYRDDNFLVIDRGSSNKVLIADKPVHKEPLHDGDVIVLGDLRLRFELNPNWEIK